jgi:hypothetical protein
VVDRGVMSACDVADLRLWNNDLTWCVKGVTERFVWSIVRLSVDCLLLLNLEKAPRRAQKNNKPQSSANTTTPETVPAIAPTLAFLPCTPAIPASGFMETVGCRKSPDFELLGDPFPGFDGIGEPVCI